MDDGATVLLWYWGRRGGGARVTTQLGKLLTGALGPGRVTIAVASDNELIDDYRALGAAITTSRPAWRRGLSLGERLGGLGDLVRFIQTLRRSAPRVIVVTMNFPFAWPIVRFVDRDRTRIVYLCHDAAPHAGDFARTWQHLSQAALLRSVDRIVALSSAVRDDIVARHGVALAPLIRVLPIQALYRNGAPRPSARRPSEPLRFLFAGRLLAYKGLDLLAEAAALLAPRADWTLTVAGEGPCEARVRDAFAGCPRCSVRIGWLSERAYEAILDEHDVVVCPYVEASQSGVLPDALARGIPGVVTPVGGLPEQIGFGRAGVVAVAVTAEAFAAAMVQLLDDRSLIARLSEGAWEIVEAASRDEWIAALLDD